MSRRRTRDDRPSRSRGDTSSRTHSRSAVNPDGSRPKRALGPGRGAQRRFGTLARVILTLGVAATTVGLGAGWALHSSYLRVHRVQFIGLRHESRATVLAATGLGADPSMIDVSASSMSHRLAVFAWIGTVSVSKRWPNTIVVTVHERTPVAVAFNAQHGLRFVDGAGYDLGPAPGTVNLPTLEYPQASNALWPYRHAGRSAAYVASQLPRAFGAQVARISENNQGVVTLFMTTPVSFILGPATNLTAKFVSIASVVAHSTLQAGDVVDVTVPGALAVTGPALK